MDATSERMAKNEAAFREANERIEAAADGMPHLDEIPFICECPGRSCTEIVRMRRDEYEQIRASGTTFWVVPGHEFDVVDGKTVSRIVERRDRFTIMEKVGEAGQMAAELNPRRPVESGA